MIARSSAASGLVAVLLLSGCASLPTSASAPTPGLAPSAGGTTPGEVSSPPPTLGSSTSGVVAVPLQPAPDHVHGLVVTDDGRLVAGTHTGVVALANDGTVSPIGASVDDFMGFTGVAGTGRLVSSGHPGEGSDLADPLGLIASDDGGTTWTAVSLAGEVDFHALATDGDLVVGYDGRAGLLVSRDAGATFSAGAPIAPAALAVDGREVWATTAQGVQHSTDGGVRFTPVDGAPFLVLVAVGVDGSLWGVDTEGATWRSREGESWEGRGQVGRVEALAALDYSRAFAVTFDTLFVLS